MKFFKMVYFTKEGKGVDKQEPQKRAFFRFWIRAFEKRYKLIGANILYVFSNLLGVAFAIFALYLALSLYVTLDGSDSDMASVLTGQNSDALRAVIMLATFIVVYFTSIPVFATGPAQAGLNFLLRSFVKEAPVFIWTDFSSKAKSNFKLSLKVSITNAIAGFFLMLDAATYLAISNNSTGAFSGVPSFILFFVVMMIVFFTLLLLMINMYIYPIIVTFKVTYRQLYKNAFILSLIRWLPNLGILILEAVMIAFPILIAPGHSGLYVPLILYVFLTPAFFGFLNNFYVNSTIQKYLIDNPAADHSVRDEDKNITKEKEGTD